MYEIMTMKEMRRDTEKQLFQYRVAKDEVSEFMQRGLKGHSLSNMRSTGRYADPTQIEAVKRVNPPAHIREKQKWCWAIEQARAMLEKTAPKKAELMVRFYGLDHPLNRTRQLRIRILDLLNDLEISEPTLYKWRAEVIQAVVIAAIQAGVLKPYEKQTQVSNA